jgi:hypothetical protein
MAKVLTRHRFVPWISRASPGCIGRVIVAVAVFFPTAPGADGDAAAFAQPPRLRALGL